MNARRWAAALLAAMMTCHAPIALAAEAPPVQVQVDPRVELASLVASLTPWAKENAEAASSGYASEALTAFGKHSNHPAVAGCSEWLSSESGNLGVLVRLALTLGPDLAESPPPGPSLSRLCGGSETAERLCSLLGQFATDTSFMGFYQAHAPFYSKIQERVSSALVRSNPAGRLESYYGTSLGRYAVLLAPLAPKDGETEAIASEGPLVVLRAMGSTKDKLPEFREGGSALTRAVTNALGRAFIEPVSSQHGSELDQSADLLKPISEDMKAYQCGTWTEAFNEHLLRAVDARLLQESGDGKLAQITLKTNERAGFAYVRDLFDQLATYEGDRKAYPTLDAFYPTILAKLSYLKDTGADQDVAKRYSSFQGPIARANDKRYLPMTVMVRPNPTDPRLKATLTSYVETVRAAYKKRYRRDIKIVSPEEAANLNPAKTSYVIFGTPWSNPFLAALIKYLPLKVSKNTLQLGDKQFLGQNLRLITAFTNPYNPALPMQIFTSTEDSGIPGIFSLPHGPNDYAIYHDTHPLAQGDYVYDLKGKWSLP